MIVLKQNLLTLAVATAFFAVPMATLQADDLPPAPPGPYSQEGVKAIEGGQEQEKQNAADSSTEMTEAATDNQAAVPAPQPLANMPMMPGHSQYYRPQVQYIYVVPVIMPKMTPEQQKEMQKQMQNGMYPMPMPQMMQQQGNTHGEGEGHDHNDEDATQQETDETKSES